MGEKRIFGQPEEAERQCDCHRKDANWRGHGLTAALVHSCGRAVTVERGAWTERARDVAEAREQEMVRPAADAGPSLPSISVGTSGRGRRRLGPRLR